jgi:hypothetical protein
LKAASTALDGAAWLAAGVLFGFGVGVAVPVSVDFVVALGVGDAFGSTVRVRVEGDVEEFVFWLVLCANARVVAISATETITRKIFTIVSSSNEPFASG